MEQEVTSGTRAVNRLPLELKQAIISKAIWAPKMTSSKQERWEDGPLSLELPQRHPLSSHFRPFKNDFLLLLDDSDRKPEPTPAENVLRSVLRTSKEFRHIGQRHTDELLAICGTLECTCECESWPRRRRGRRRWHECDPGASWGVKTQRGTPSALVRALGVNGIEANYTREPVQASVYKCWPALPTAAFDFLRPCSGLVALSLAGSNLGWLPSILDALPSRGARLQQLSIIYPHRTREPSDSSLEKVLTALNQCSSLSVFEAIHDWQEGPPIASKAIAFVLRALGGLGAQRAAVRIAGFESDTPLGSLGGRTAMEIVRKPFQLGISRLAIAYTGVENEIIQRVIEATSEQLEYLSLEQNDYITINDDLSLSAPIKFPRLRHVSIRPREEPDPGLEPSVLPSHWQLPVIEHLTASEVGVMGARDVAIFADRVREWPTLLYLKVQGCWNWWEEDDVDDLWAARLEASLREEGVDAHLLFEDWS